MITRNKKKNKKNVFPSEKRIIVPCDCGGYHHLEISKWADDGEVFICMVAADNPLRFRRRLIEAFKLLFLVGRESCYHDILVNKREFKKLKNFFKTL